jgi:hypothetical protein
MIRMTRHPLPRVVAVKTAASANVPIASGKGKGLWIEQVMIKAAHA